MHDQTPLKNRDAKPILRVKNWKEFQHYKNRRPPWIKLHKALLEDPEFAELPIESKAVAPLLWLLASESLDGCFQADSKTLAFRLRIASDVLAEALPPLIDKGFFEVASTMLAPRLHGAIPETEGEAETEVLPSEGVFLEEVEIEAPRGGNGAAAPAEGDLDFLGSEMGGIDTTQEGWADDDQ